MKNLSKIIFLVAAFLATKMSALAIIGGGGGTLPPGRPITLTDLDYVIFRISVFFITVSGVVALIFIIWSGVTYMYAGDDKTKVDAAKARLKSGIIGAAIIFGAGVIIQTVVSVVTLDFFCQFRLGGICLIP